MRATIYFKSPALRARASERRDLEVRPSSAPSTSSFSLKVLFQVHAHTKEKSKTSMFFNSGNSVILFLCASSGCVYCNNNKEREKEEKEEKGEEGKGKILICECIGRCVCMREMRMRMGRRWRGLHLRLTSSSSRRNKSWKGVLYMQAA